MAPNEKTPRTASNSAETRTGEKERPTLLSRTSTLINHVIRSEEYVEQRSRDYPASKAYIKAVIDILNNPDNGFDGLDRALLTTTAHLGSFINAVGELRAIEERTGFGGQTSGSSSFREEKLKINYIIPFNHSLKEIINEAPNASLGDLATTLTKAHTYIFSGQGAQSPGIKKTERTPLDQGNVLYEFIARIDGMRSEVAAETLLSAAGIDFDSNVSPRQDAAGIDIIVLENDPEPIDVKATEELESKAHLANPRSRAVWTGLTRADFRGMKDDKTDALSISYSTAQEHAAAFVERIHQVVGTNEQQRRESISRGLARSTRY